MALISSVILTLMLISSCRYQPDVSYSFGTPETWEELFSAYWNKMNTNYVFWDLDYDGGAGWDDVYDHYLPLFRNLGKIGEESADTALAKNYFYEITSELSDGHYGMYLNDGTGSTSLFNPNTNRILSRLGYSEGKIYNFIMSYDGSTFTAETDEEYLSYYNYNRENMSNIIRLVFDKSEIIPSSGSFLSNASGTPITVDSYFEEFYYTLINSSSEGLYAVYGKSEDGILYFGFNSFSFYYWMVTVQSSSEATETQKQISSELITLVERFTDALTEDDVKGVIIDLRGNGGGYLADLNLLWSDFTPGEDVYYTDTRIKAGDNRLEYGPWVPSYIDKEDTAFNKNIPITVLINGNTLSSAEMSTMFFMALRDYYGYDVTVIGDNSGGGTGYLIRNTDQITNSGSTAIEPYISLVYTPSAETRYRSGVNYEGEGITPDITIDFDAAAFNSGVDTRLEAAFAYLRSR